jgi:hypothetical protein
MNTYLGIFLIIILIVIIGGFLPVYIGVLLEVPKPFTTNGLIKYTAAALFLLIIFGTIVNWFADCSLGNNKQN